MNELRQVWDQLAARQQTPLLGFDWFSCCAECLHKDSTLRIVVVRKDSRIVAIAPMFIQSSGAYPRLEVFGTSLLSEPSGLLFENRSALDFLLESLAKLDFPVCLLRIPSDDPYSGIGKIAFSRRALRMSRKSSPSVYIVPKGDWNDFQLALSSSRRRDLRRKRRRTEKLGEARVSVISPRLSEFERYFDLAVSIEDRSWKGRNQSSLLRKPDLLAFFRRYCRIACTNGLLRFFFLNIGDRTVATLMAVESHGSLWVLKLGFDEDFSDCSPGFALSHESIKYVVENEISKYEFLGSEEPWQSSWPTSRRSFMSVLIFPWSLKGMRGLLLLVLEQMGKLVMKRAENV